MAKRLLFKRSLALVLIFTLLSGGAVFAQQQGDGQALRLNFSDVPDNLWSQKHVSKLALLGVTEGYEDGTFRPGNHVTQQEVIKMALSLMGYTDLENNVHITQPNHIFNFLKVNVADWAQAYVSKAFELGVLDYNFEVDNNRNVNWGTKYATREWVAKLVIQAIGEEELAAELAETNSHFVDGSTISAWALGYVNAAAQLNIVTGSDDGMFKPRDLVTRAELAAFLSRGENYMSERSERVKVGTLLQFSLRDITLMTDDGQVETFTLHRDQKFYSYKEPNNAISSTQIVQYTRVAVIAHAGVAYYVEVIDDQQQLITKEGILLALEQGAQSTISMQVDGQQETYVLDSFVKVLNEQNIGLSLRELVIGSKVQVKFNTVIADTLTAASRIIEIKVLQAPLNKVGSGVIEIVDATNDQLTIRDAVNHEVMTYALAADVDIKIGTRTLQLSDLHAGDEVDYEIVNSLLTSLRVTNSSTPFVETAQGIIKSYHANSGIIAIEDASGVTARYFADVVTVVLEGHHAPTIAELENDDLVKLYINSFGEVTRVDVLNREIKRMVQVEIVKYHEESANLFVILDGREGNSFKISDDTVIIYGEQQYNLNNFDFAAHFVEGKKVDMTFTNDKLMEIKLSNYYDGVVKQLDTAARRLTLAMNGSEQVFTLPSITAIETYRGTSISLSDLQVGDEVRVNLNADQTQVSSIQVKQTVLYRTIDTQLATRTVTVKDQAGESFNLIVYASIPLKHYDKSNATFIDIQANDLLIVQYRGITIESIEVSEATVGIVQDINVLNQRLTVNGYDGQTQTWIWSSTPQLFDGATNKPLALNTLRVNDRLQVVVDHTGKLFMTTLEVRDKQFWKFESDREQVYYRGEQAGFKLDANAHITENGTVVPVTHFVGKGFPLVKFYMLNGIVYEIERN